MLEIFTTRLTRLLRIAVPLLVSVSTNVVAAQDARLFHKSFPDGSQVRLTSSTITEFRSRPRSANPDAPEKEIYSDREWKLVTYDLLLKRPNVNEEEILWRKDVDYSAADRKSYYISGTLAVNDVFLDGNRAYVLYSVEGFVSVVNLTRNKDGDWLGSVPKDLAQSTDVYPISRWIFTNRARPQIAIDVLVHGKTRTAIWDLKGDRWVLKK